jgi:hypothetical protein
MNSALRLKIGNIYFVLWVVPFSVFGFKTRLWRGFDLHLIVLVVFLLIWVSIREGDT